ncbi:MAG: hypothetical protein A2W63_01685 [Deltaproteobacteria bacterium RIFCSPLOWO2_02_44_9]|nr:MAG: hypothetical protein A2W63_01685 [Deltaproteobacteria bacterium RIFCSPLOWO2_02_44_9]
MDKKSILYILLAILAFSVFYRVATVPEEKRAPLKYKTGAKSSELGVGSSEFKTGKEDIPRIELSKLTSAKGKPPADGVNLFYPFFVKVEPPKPPEPLKPVVPLPLPVDPLEEELKLFRFLGFLEERLPAGRDKRIFLSKGQNIYIVRNGDIIEGRFKVDIKGDVIEVSGINSEKMVAIPITER